VRKDPREEGTFITRGSELSQGVQRGAGKGGKKNPSRDGKAKSSRKKGFKEKGNTYKEERKKGEK